MFSAIGRSQIGVDPWIQRIVRGRSGRFARLFGLTWLAALVLLAAAGSVAAYAATPTVTGVSPDTGPPAGGTPVAIRGTGFAVGKSATRFTFGDEAEAAAVDCTTTTECTATSPEMSTDDFGIVDVTATVEEAVSPPTVDDQFEYYGLYLLDLNGRLGVGGDFDGANGEVSADETSTCNAFVGGRVLSDGEVTDELEVLAEHFESCDTNQFFGDLPFSFGLRLGADGSATIEGPMGVRTREDCVYEGDRLSGSFESEGALLVELGGTFTLVDEEKPGTECPATNSVFVNLFTERNHAEKIGAARPTVTGLSPGTGPEAGGTSVTITGEGLGEASAVEFGSTDAPSFTVNSPSSITAVSPSGEGTVAVTVTSPRGMGTAGGTGDEFTYGPAVSGIEPNHGPRAGGTSVTITGVNLDDASAVTFGATPAASFTVNSPTSVTAVSPAGTGMVDVTVNTSEGTSPTGAQDRFSYDVPPPTITEISPANGPEAGGTAITVSGTDFTGATGVKFGATNATSFTVNSDTSLTAVSPGGTGTVDVSVTTPNGTSTNGVPDRFTYQPLESGLPEIGRCVKITPVKEGKVLVYHGSYETAKCTTTSATHHGKYEWSAGPGAARGFTGTSKGAKLETLHEVDHLGPHSKITCESGSATGEFTGVHSAVATITFSACVDVKSKVSCQSAGQPDGQVQTGTLDGELGVIKGGETPVIGIAFRPHGSTPLASIECGVSSVTVEGAIIAPVKATDGMSTKHSLAFKGHEGAQTPIAFEGGPPETLSVGEPISLNVTMALTGIESLEVKATV